jgi:hypothetical protein
MFNLNFYIKMAVFSVNQNRQFYVAKAVGTVTDAAAEGTIEVDTFGEGKEKCVFFKYKGPGGVIKSDYIPVELIEYAKAVSADSMAVAPKISTVSITNNPIVGQDYVLRITFRQFYGMSDEDVYIKDAAVHVTSAISSKALFASAMVDALKKAFSREIGANINENPYLDFTVSGNDIVIKEKPQDWTLGIGAQERVYFDVQPTTIFDGSDDVIWGTVANSADTANKIGNGKKIADLEYFFMGDRGDQYRMQGWPNYIPTKYLVDPTKNYNVFELHYSFVDTGVNSYKSEKDITIVADADGGPLNTLIGNFNTATGLEVATITGE